jgi:oxygen-independent coproporphyrinogen-3 oxidase
VNARHVYVHVPFCARRCTYCDFSIAVRRRVPVGAYLDALRAELAWTGAPPSPLTLYLGGGTPSLLGAEGVVALADLLGVGQDTEEFTLEANPEDVTPETTRAWRRAGVNRLSLGAQSFEPGVLRWMRRTHEAATIPRAVAAARAAGIANISLDLIFALPSHLERDFRRDLACAVALEPDHLSLYGLTVEPRTVLARQIARGESAEAAEDRYEQDYLLAHDVLGRAGYRFYEVSNAARPGREAVHNRAYWQLVPYLGLGPSAHSFDGASRWWNEPAYARWAARLARGENPVAGREIVGGQQRRTEQLYLGLRTSEGTELAPESEQPAAWKTARAWVAAGWAVLGDRQPARLTLTPRGWLRLDELVASF